MDIYIYIRVGIRVYGGSDGHVRVVIWINICVWSCGCVVVRMGM